MALYWGYPQINQAEHPKPATMTMTKLASSLPAALVRRSAQGCNTNPSLECCTVGTQRYLTSSDGSKAPELTKVGASGGKHAATQQELAPDTATLDTMPSISTTASSSSEHSFFGSTRAQRAFRKFWLLSQRRKCQFRLQVVRNFFSTGKPKLYSFPRQAAWYTWIRVWTTGSDLD